MACGNNKNDIKKDYWETLFNSYQLQTIITEVEAVINSRRLFYVDDELENQIIAPNYFLSLNVKNGTPELIRNNEDVDKNNCLIIKGKN